MMALALPFLRDRGKETGYLIERQAWHGRPCYWTGAPAASGSACWTFDPGEAIRFARKRDGARCAERQILGAVRVCAHQWVKR